MFNSSESLLLLITIFCILLVTKTQVCGPSNPVTTDDCTGYSDDKENCCLTVLSYYNETAFVCLFIQKNQTAITPYITSLDLGMNNGSLVNVNIDCGNKIDGSNLFSSCGDNPTTFEDCNKNSTATTTCCYLESPDNKTACIRTSVVSTGNSSYFGVNVVCDSKSIIPNYLVLILYIVYF